MIHLQIIIGSVREGRKSLPVAEWAFEQLKPRNDLSVELIDLKAWAFPLFALPNPPAMGDYRDPLQKRWAAKVAEADGYVFVSPEYNHGYSPALKNALDYVYAEWGRKPAAFVSFGGAGGARSVEQLRLVTIALEMAPLASAVHIMGAGKKIEAGKFKADERDAKSFNELADELVWWAEALKLARGETLLPGDGS